jgi:branched-subunit amino acid aminotransferase/4-amino-4-deoxychorismate lyase
LPDDEAVKVLRRAGTAHETPSVEAAGQPAATDLRLRIVLSGGDPPAGRSLIWMTAGALPPAMHGGARILRTMRVDPDDPLTRHKTLNYWRRRIEQARAADEGADEVLGVTPDGSVCEGTRSNLFVVRDRRLITPGADGPLLDGVMRRVVIERARATNLEVVEEAVPLSSLESADEAFLTNSVRGMLPVARLLATELPAPGPVTQGLRGRILAWLNSGGTST